MEQNVEFIGIRVPSKLRRKVERERKRMSRAAGVHVNTSAAIRALIQQALDMRCARATGRS
jgi:hypothetical protein